MSKFPIRICPLCSKKLQIGDEDSMYTYFCSEFYLVNRPFIWGSYGSSFMGLSNIADFSGGKSKEPHYAVNISDGKWTQSVIIPPYWILSDLQTKKSTIHKHPKELATPSESTFLMEVPLLSPDNYLPEKLAQKIKNLVIFT